MMDKDFIYSEHDIIESYRSAYKNRINVFDKEGRDNLIQQALHIYVQDVHYDKVLNTAILYMLNSDTYLIVHSTHCSLLCYL